MVACCGLDALGTRVNDATKTKKTIDAPDGNTRPDEVSKLAVEDPHMTGTLVRSLRLRSEQYRFDSLPQTDEKDNRHADVHDEECIVESGTKVVC